MKTIKKLLCGVVSCALASTLLGSITLGVTAADDFTVKISSETAEPGESYTLSLDLENIPSPGINVCDFGISFDSSLVTVESVELGSLADDVTTSGDLPSPFAYSIDTDVVDVLFSDVSGTVLNGSGTFLNITGKVNSTAADGSEAEFKVVPIDRAVTPGSGTSNEKVIFAYLGDDITEHSPVLVSGKVTIRETPVTTLPVTTIVTQPVTTTVQTTTQPSTTIVTQPVTTTALTTTQPSTTISTQPVTTTVKATTTKATTTTTQTTTTVQTTTTTAKTTTPVVTTTVTTTAPDPNKLIPGDVNLDKTVTVADVVLMQKYFVKSEKFSFVQLTVADFNEDSTVNIFDVMALKRFLLNNN